MTPEPTVSSAIAAWLVGGVLIAGMIVIAAIADKFLDINVDPENVFKDFFGKK